MKVVPKHTREATDARFPLGTRAHLTAYPSVTGVVFGHLINPDFVLFRRDDRVDLDPLTNSDKVTHVDELT